MGRVRAQDAMARFHVKLEPAPAQDPSPAPRRTGLSPRRLRGLPWVGIGQSVVPGNATDRAIGSCCGLDGTFALCAPAPFSCWWCADHHARRRPAFPGNAWIGPDAMGAGGRVAEEPGRAGGEHPVGRSRHGRRAMACTCAAMIQRAEHSCRPVHGAGSRSGRLRAMWSISGAVRGRACNRGSAAIWRGWTGYAALPRRRWTGRGL